MAALTMFMAYAINEHSKHDLKEYITALWVLVGLGGVICLANRGGLQQRNHDLLMRTILRTETSAKTVQPSVEKQFSPIY